MGFQVAFENENVFAQSNLSREFQVDGAATEKVQHVSSVCVRGTTSSGASDERRARGGACTSLLRYVGVAVVCTRILHNF